MVKAALCAACGVLLLPVLAIAAGTGVIGGIGSVGAIAPAAVADIPPRYMQLYQAAATRYRIPWELLAAIGKTECDHGRNPDPSCTHEGAANYAGAGGPMQFLASTWATYGVDADGDRRADRWNPADAIFGAANYLRASGAPGDLQRAIYAYNHSGIYVDNVVALMQKYRQEAAAAPPVGGVAPSLGGMDLGDRAALAHAVLSDPRLGLRPEAALDVRAGRLDPRLLAALLALSEHFQLDGVGPCISGHSTYVAGTNRISNHTAGRACDIGTVDGQLVRASSPAARQLVIVAASLPASIRPTEIGSPFVLSGCRVCFSDADHQDHIHLGFDA
jgi:hypothetical protein